MKRHFAGLLGLVTILAAAPAFAGVTFTTNAGATNSVGNAVSASAEFTVVPDGILVKINNLTPSIKNFNQSIQGITFTVYGRRAQGTIDYSRARTRTITPDSMNSSPEASSTDWQLTTTGSTYTLRAPGRQSHILPDTSDLTYPHANKTLKDAPEANPFLVGPVVIHIQNKDIALTDDIIGVKFSWGDELGGFDAKLTADTAGGAVNTAGGGGGGGGGGIGGTPGDISLAPPTAGEDFSLGQQGALYGQVGGADAGGYGVPPGGGGGVGDGTNNNRRANQATAPVKTMPSLSDFAGDTSPNPDPPTAVASTQPATPEVTGDAPPDIRVPIGSVLEPNPTPPTATALDTTPVNGLPDPSTIVPVSVNSAPEPATLALVGMGIVGILARRRRRA